MNRTEEHFRLSENPFGLRYRPDIEGVRGVAILLVVAAHAEVAWLLGGFVGVDVFFVMSGYLITALLFQELRQSGGIKLWRFYARRFRRLLPALLFMLICTSLVTSILLAPFEQLNQIGAARAAALWISNFYFAASDFDYFGATADQNLFLHTWSLAVEEQFYLVWPLLLMFLLGTWRWQGATLNVRRLVLGLATTIAICFLFSLFLQYTEPLWAFYLMPSRVWQFALGALAWLFVSERIGSIGSIPRRFAGAGGWIGMGLIMSAAVALDSNMTYPGAWALLPSVGTALVLMCGAIAPGSRASRVLALKPLQWMGRISYSWYLWHWPALVFDKLLSNSGQSDHTGLALVLSLGMAVISYRAVELPIRLHRNLAKRTRMTVVGSFSAMLIFGVSSAGWQRVAMSWSDDPTQKFYSGLRTDVPAIYPLGCDDWYYSSQVRVCMFGDRGAPHTAVLIGDSIMAQWFPAFEKIFTVAGWRLLVLTKSSCPMVDEPFFYKRIGMQYKICESWRREALQTLVTLEPDVLFMGQASDYVFSESQWIAGTQKILAKLAPATGRVFMVRGTSRLPFDGPGCLARREWTPTMISTTGDCSSASGDRSDNDVHTWLKRAARDFSNVTTLDLNELVCPRSRCSAENKGQVVFRDSQHIATHYALSLSEAIKNRINVR